MHRASRQWRDSRTIEKGRCVPKKQRPRFWDDLTFVLEQLRRANLFNQLAKTIDSRENSPHSMTIGWRIADT
jgi:hypothetical protein